jgi:hypothetical protein
MRPVASRFATRPVVVAVACFGAGLVTALSIGSEAAPEPFRANYGNVVKPQLYGGGSLNGHAMVAAKATASAPLGNDFLGAFRGDVSAESGGKYSPAPSGGVQTAFPAFNAQVSMGTAGQAVAFFAYVNGRGKGNAMFGNGRVDCYGGGEVYGADSIPLCSPLGEFEANIGDRVFVARVNGAPAAGARSLTYIPVSGEVAIGQRPMFARGRGYAEGSLESAHGRAIALNGSRLTTLQGKGPFYFKTSSKEDYYAPPCKGDDVVFEGACFGHWYRVGRIVDDTHLELEFPFDDKGLTSAKGAPYMLIEGAEIEAYDVGKHTIALPSNAFSWADGDQIYAPPNHLQRINGLALVVRKPFKTLDGGTPFQGVDSNAVIALNHGPGRMDHGLFLSGDPASKLGGFYDGVTFDNFTGAGTGIDSRNVDWQTAAIAVRRSNGRNNKIVMGDTGKLSYDGKNVVIEGAPVDVATGVAPDGGGLKHLRAATGPVAKRSTRVIDLAWSRPFADDHYTVTCSVMDATGSLSVAQLRAQTPSAISVAVKNEDAQISRSGTLHCVGMHD